MDEGMNGGAPIQFTRLMEPRSLLAKVKQQRCLSGGRIVYAEGKYAGLSPPQAKAAPDLLPINAYPGYRKADRADHRIKLAASALSAAMPTIIGGDGRSWILGCGCGLRGARHRTSGEIEQLLEGAAAEVFRPLIGAAQYGSLDAQKIYPG